MRFAGLTIVFSLFAAMELRAETIFLGTGVNSDPPYVYGDSAIRDKKPGITIELIKAVEAKLNLDFRIIKMPWARVVEEVKSNRLHGGFHFSYVPERKTFVAYPINENNDKPNSEFSLSSRSDMLYRLKGSSLHWNNSAFALTNGTPATIGIIRGGAIEQDLNLTGDNIVKVGTDEQLIELLLLRRVDGVIGLSSMMDIQIAKLDDKAQKKLEKVPQPLTTKHFYIGFSQSFASDNSELVWKIWQTLKELKTDGTMEKLTHKYNKH